MENVQYYESGVLCPHCAWLSGKKKIIEKTRTRQWANYKPYWTGEGVTVFDVHGVFTNTFNCVNGEYSEDSMSYHNPMDLGHLLRGATMFIEYLNHKYGVKKVRLLINSHANPERFGGNGKEHPHAMITVEDPNFFKTKGDPAKEPPSKPLPDDLFIDLDSADCKELIRQGEDTIPFITELLKKRLDLKKFDPETESFYIFLSYSCQDSCGFIKGKIAI